MLITPGSSTVNGFFIFFLTLLTYFETGPIFFFLFLKLLKEEIQLQAQLSLTLSPLTSVCTFSILFSIHFLLALTRRISLMNESFFFPLFLLPYCVIKG